jgi:hypothetical protein
LAALCNHTWLLLLASTRFLYQAGSQPMWLTIGVHQPPLLLATAALVPSHTATDKLDPMATLSEQPCTAPSSSASSMAALKL